MLFRRAAEAALKAWPEAAGEAVPHTAGHINDTWFVGDRFVLQRLNQFVFPRPQAVMRNLAKAVAHEGGRLLVAPIPTAGGALFATDAAGDVWRLFSRLAARNFQTLPDQLLAAAGDAFGRFLARFADFQDELEPVIDGFHDLDGYLQRLDEAPKTDASVDSERRDVDALRGAFRRGKGKRVIHGDCKVNNLLFHPAEDAVVAIIDLDTLMAGDPAWDFGDLVRSAFAGSEETTAGSELAIARFEPLCRGFVAQMGSIDGIERYAAAPAYMSFMLAVRFLTDHLEGDPYFKVAQHGDNLLRARSQLDLAKRFLDARQTMAGILENALAESASRPPGRRLC